MSLFLIVNWLPTLMVSRGLTRYGASLVLVSFNVLSLDNAGVIVPNQVVQASLERVDWNCVQSVDPISRQNTWTCDETRTPSGSQRLTTDAQGRVDFDTCFPGWYAGRAIHIHFRVDVSDTEYVTSQLFFTDALVAEIFSSHALYSPYGQPDTSLTTDNVIGRTSDKSPYLLDTARMADGAMLASKLVTIRSSLGTSLCAA